VQATLERLLERELVVRHPRRPGQKEDRYEQVLGGDAEGDRPEQAPGAPMAAADSGSPAAEPETPDEDRLDRLERQLGELRAEVSSLRKALGD